MQPFNTEKSKEVFIELKNYLVDGVASSFHKAACEEYPICMTHGKGSKIYDVDGNEYIDYVLGFGPVLLGHAPESVAKAVEIQLQKGTQLSAPTPDLLTLTKKITQIIPCAEKVIYQNTGTEAVMTAFRVARAYTGKNKILKFEGQYHGWSDEEKVTIDAGKTAELGPLDNPNKLMNTAGQRKAAVDDVIIAPWNDLETLNKIVAREGDTIACIVMEPFMCDSGPIYPKEGYLAAVKELCDKNNIVLCFDEVITGFRMSIGGAQKYFGVTPHIATFGKAMTAGYSLSMIAGKKEIMDSGVHASGTYNANPVAVAASLATIKELEIPGTYDRMEKLGESLCDGMRRLGEKHGISLYCRATGSIVMLQFGVKHEACDFRTFLDTADVPRYEKLFALANKYGVRLTSKRGRIYLSTAHTDDDIVKTLEVLDHCFGEI